MLRKVNSSRFLLKRSLFVGFLRALFSFFVHKLIYLFPLCATMGKDDQNQKGSSGKRSKPNEEEPWDVTDGQIHINSERVGDLEKHVEELEKQLNGVKEVQLKQQRTIHGLEKVTRGHNLRIFGLDKNYLVQNKIITSDEWVAVFHYLLVRGLNFDEGEASKIIDHIDVIHELATGGFIVCFTRRTDKALIINKKRNLGAWAPCSKMGNKYKYVSIQVDLPAQEQAEKVLRNQMCKVYKDAGLKVKYVGWNKMAVGDGLAQLFSSFPNDPKEFKKNNPTVAASASMNRN